jgi:hypothetical protein
MERQKNPLLSRAYRESSDGPDTGGRWRAALNRRQTSCVHTHTRLETRFPSSAHHQAALLFPAFAARTPSPSLAASCLVFSSFLLFGVTWVFATPSRSPVSLSPLVPVGGPWRSCCCSSSLFCSSSPWVIIHRRQSSIRKADMQGMSNSFRSLHPTSLFIVLSLFFSGRGWAWLIPG